MDLKVQQLSIKDFESLQVAMHVKAEYCKRRGLDHLQPYFDFGDEVGFFDLSSPVYPRVGVIVAEDVNGVTVQTAEGTRHRISPFLMFRLR